MSDTATQTAHRVTVTLSGGVAEAAEWLTSA
jgi:hypothetical protein